MSMTDSAHKKVLVMAGGTGGHIFPGLAVADYLKAKGWQVRWLGTPGRMEATLVPEHGYDIDFIDVVGVRGNGIKRLLMAPFMVIKSIRQASKVIDEFKPDVVVGFGGFASGPGGIAAWLKRVPMVLHEQNAIAGVTNSILAYFAKSVLMAFPNTFEPKHKARLVGNPVRAEIAQLAAELTGKKVKEQDNNAHKINILVVGGSLGAKVFNDDLPAILAGTELQWQLNIWHQTGKSRSNDDIAAKVEKNYRDSGFTELKVTEFIADMAKAYQWADLVICRAGALTVCEVAAAGKAAVFVPFPHAVDDHQTLNAKWLADEHGAIIVQQRDLHQPAVLGELTELLSSENEIIKMGEKAQSIAIIDATEQVAHCCIEHAEQKGLANKKMTDVK